MHHATWLKRARLHPARSPCVHLDKAEKPVARLAPAANADFTFLPVLEERLHLRAFIVLTLLTLRSALRSARRAALARVGKHVKNHSRSLVHFDRSICEIRFSLCYRSLVVYDPNSIGETESESRQQHIHTHENKARTGFGDRTSTHENKMAARTGLGSRDLRLTDLVDASESLSLSSTMQASIDQYDKKVALAFLKEAKDESDTELYAVLQKETTAYVSETELFKAVQSIRRAYPYFDSKKIKEQRFAFGVFAYRAFFATPDNTDLVDALQQFVNTAEPMEVTMCRAKEHFSKRHGELDAECQFGFVDELVLSTVRKLAEKAEEVTTLIHYCLQTLFSESAMSVLKEVASASGWPSAFAEDGQKLKKAKLEELPGKIRTFKRGLSAVRMPMRVSDEHWPGANQEEEEEKDHKNPRGMSDHIAEWFTGSPSTMVCTIVDMTLFLDYFARGQPNPDEFWLVLRFIGLSSIHTNCYVRETNPTRTRLTGTMEFMRQLPALSNLATSTEQSAWANAWRRWRLYIAFQLVHGVFENPGEPYRYEVLVPYDAEDFDELAKKKRGEARVLESYGFHVPPGTREGNREIMQCIAEGRDVTPDERSRVPPKKLIVREFWKTDDDFGYPGDLERLLRAIQLAEFKEVPRPGTYTSTIKGGRGRVQMVWEKAVMEDWDRGNEKLIDVYPFMFNK